jgi:uncharacterized protein
VRPLGDPEIDELQACLDRVPAPLEPLDVSMLDGYLCGVLLQPQRIPESRWLPPVTDVDGRALPARFDARALHALVRRRHAELDDAIERRQWFDPWVFELADEGSPPPAHKTDRGRPAAPSTDELDAEHDTPPPIDAVLPWVAGFATAQELFPALMQADEHELTPPLALIYRHLAPDDLEDADALLEEIDSLEPPSDLGEAVEGLVRATLLLADISRPRPASARAAPPARRRPVRRG